MRHSKYRVLLIIVLKFDENAVTIHATYRNVSGRHAATIMSDQNVA